MLEQVYCRGRLPHLLPELWLHPCKSIETAKTEGGWQVDGQQELIPIEYAGISTQREKQLAVKQTVKQQIHRAEEPTGLGGVSKSAGPRGTGGMGACMCLARPALRELHRCGCVR